MEKLEVTCPDEAATMQVAQKMASRLRGGELIELAGDLGAGKTTFVKGLAKGLGSKDDVSSPSFVIKNVYAGRLELVHFDLYRLEEPGHIRHEILDALGRKDSVVVIEWAGSVLAALPAEPIRVEFTPQDETARRLIVSYPEQKGRG